MEIEKNGHVEVRRWIFRILLFLYDALIVNFAYFMAIIIRFYIEYRWHDMGAQYIEMLWKFAPYYTVVSLLIFVLFQLYRGVWRYIGINDAQKLILANVCTCVFQVIGGLLIVGRMPITYYCIGAGLQFVLMSIPRVAPRFILEAFGRADVAADRDGSTTGGIDSTTRNSGGKGARTTMPMMIIGVGENARIIQRIVSKDKSSILRAVCVADFTGRYSGSAFNGLPVVSNMKDIEIAVVKYDIKCVIMSDDRLSASVENNIRDICDKHDIELRSFSMKAEHRGGGMRLSDLLRMIDGPVRIIGDVTENESGQVGENQDQSSEGEAFSTGKDALEKYHYNYVVDGISSSNDATCVKIHRILTSSIPQDEEWVKKIKEENGGEVSFFV